MHENPRATPRIWQPDWLVLRGMAQVLRRVLADPALTLPGARVLDFGCGARPYERWFAAAGARYRGADIDGAHEVRIRDDGTIPTDNPFVGKEGYKPDLYTIGHRNPLGLTIHPVTHELWSTEFGPRGGDELNRIQAGKNYGWILVTEGQHYNGEPTARGKNSVPGMEDPVLFWVPSINPGNLAFYEGDKFPAWRGDLLMAAMSRSLLRASFDAAGKPVGQERMLTELQQRLRDVRQGPDGLIYLLTDETAGAMLRIEPAK